MKRQIDATLVVEYDAFGFEQVPLMQTRPSLQSSARKQSSPRPAAPWGPPHAAGAAHAVASPITQTDYRRRTMALDPSILKSVEGRELVALFDGLAFAHM